MNREIAYIERSHFKPEYQCLVNDAEECEVAVDGEWSMQDFDTVGEDAITEEAFEFANEILIGDFSTPHTIPTLKGDMLTHEGYDYIRDQIKENTGCDNVEWFITGVKSDKQALMINR